MFEILVFFNTCPPGLENVEAVLQVLIFLLGELRLLLCEKIFELLTVENNSVKLTELRNSKKVFVVNYFGHAVLCPSHVTDPKCLLRCVPLQHHIRLITQLVFEFVVQLSAHFANFGLLGVYAGNEEQTK